MLPGVPRRAVRKHGDSGGGDGCGPLRQASVIRWGRFAQSATTAAHLVGADVLLALVVFSILCDNIDFSAVNVNSSVRWDGAPAGRRLGSGSRDTASGTAPHREGVRWWWRKCMGAVRDCDDMLTSYSPDFRGDSGHWGRAAQNGNAVGTMCRGRLWRLGVR
eukprot:gene7716-biopygen12078